MPHSTRRPQRYWQGGKNGTKEFVCSSSEYPSGYRSPDVTSLPNQGQIAKRGLFLGWPACVQFQSVKVPNIPQGPQHRVAHHSLDADMLEYCIIGQSFNRLISACTCFTLVQITKKLFI